MFPRADFSKGDVIEYYRDIAPVMMPYLKDRPLTLKRYPDGVDGDYFYEKNAPAYTPEWIETFAVERTDTKRGGKSIRYILINDLATLLWCANLADLEIHTFLAKAPRVDRPSWIMLDLDPGPPADILQCAEVALLIRDTLERLSLSCYCKVSGSKGIQVYVPFNTSITFDQTRPFAQAIARLLEQQHPNLIVSKMTKFIRGGKVYIDWAQNDEHKTTVAPYSLRAKHPEPFVAAPCSWNELSKALKKGDAELLYYSPGDALKRAKKEDPLMPILKQRQKLPLEYQNMLKPPKPVKGVKGNDLLAYGKKRDFSRTSEPTPKKAKLRTRDLIFVIQKHDASRLHYDLRLEMEGVLRSWAVPKGLSPEAGVRRLAMHVEDHPLDYGTFEGTIPKGNYGAGTVMLWDFGSYEAVGSDPVKGYYDGKLHVRFNGKKIKGEWVLVRTKDPKQWFVIKIAPSAKPISKKKDNESASSGRSMGKIAAEKDSVWKGNGVEHS